MALANGAERPCDTMHHGCPHTFLMSAPPMPVGGLQKSEAFPEPLRNKNAQELSTIWSCVCRNHMKDITTTFCFCAVGSSESSRSCHLCNKVCSSIAVMSCLNATF